MTRHPATRRRRLVALCMLTGAAVALPGCQAVAEVALRLNSDGTVDFGSCLEVGTIVAIDARTYVRTEHDTTPTPLVVQSPPSEMTVGTVLNLGTPPPAEEWDRIAVDITGVMFRGKPRDLYGIFDQAELKVDEWVWQARDPEDVCELNE